MERLIRNICAFSTVVTLSIAIVVPTVAEAFNISGPDGQIIDPVSGAVFNVSLLTGETGIIADINVSIEFAPTGISESIIPPDQPWDDFVMTISKGATTVVLHGSPTSSGPNPGVLFDVTFDDEAGSTLSDLIGGATVPPLPDAVGSFKPDGGSLSAFDGMELAGTWTLGFDESCCVNETILASWSISGALVPIPAAVWLFGSALGLLGWMRGAPAIFSAYQK